MDPGLRVYPGVVRAFGIQRTALRPAGNCACAQAHNS
jgi:hypothetical protein